MFSSSLIKTTLSITKRKYKTFLLIYHVFTGCFMKTDIDKFVINRIREMRKEKGFSQRGMTEFLHCSVGFIGQVESPNHETKYSVYQIYQIAKEFECSVADFFPPTIPENP